jgi:hypothetical protein
LPQFLIDQKESFFMEQKKAFQHFPFEPEPTSKPDLTQITFGTVIGFTLFSPSKLSISSWHFQN